MAKDRSVLSPIPNHVPKTKQTNPAELEYVTPIVIQQPTDNTESLLICS